MNELKRIQKVYEDRISDAIVERYSLFRAGELYMLQQREVRTLQLLRRVGWTSLRDRSILEVGCGRGHRLADFQRWGADPERLYGVDLMAAFVREARHNYPRFAIVEASGHGLPFPAESFDLVTQSTVFTSIIDPTLRMRIAREMVRVLKPEGIILWYDFRYPNPRNADVVPLRRAEIRSLFPHESCQFSSVTLLPPLARRLAPLSLAACRLLESFPLLRSHYLAVIRKRPLGQ